MAIHTIATITYQHGSGPDNRQIDFTRTGAAGPVQARFTILGNPTQILGNLSEDQIIVEMESTTQKMNRMVAQRNSQPFPAPVPNSLLSALPNTAAKDGVIRAINVNSAAHGGRRIQVESAPGGAHGEIVTRLTITDPR